MRKTKIATIMFRGIYMFQVYTVPPHKGRDLHELKVRYNGG